MSPRQSAPSLKIENASSEAVQRRWVLVMTERATVQSTGIARTSAARSAGTLPYESLISVWKATPATVPFLKNDRSLIRDDRGPKNTRSSKLDTSEIITE